MNLADAVFILPWLAMAATAAWIARRDRRRNTWREISHNDHHRMSAALTRQRTTFDDGWTF